MKKVLVINYSFPPSNIVSIHRILRLGRWLPKYGWQPLILTSKKRLDTRVDKNNVDYAQKHFPYVYEANSFFSSLYVYVLSKRTLFFKLIRYFVNKLIIPDSYVHWYFCGRKTGLKIAKEQKVDLIWASLPHGTTGLIAKYISKKTGIPLLIDYRDPWTLSRFHKPGHFLKKRLNIYFEKNMLKQATAICTTSRPMSKLFVDNQYFNKKHVYTLTNSVDEELQHVDSYTPSQQLLKENIINITHIGGFYGDRQPYAFLDAVAILAKPDNTIKERVHINFFGNSKTHHLIEYCEKLNIADICRFEGFVPYKTSMHILMESDILFLLNGVAPHNNIYIPGKLFDYLAAKKPILFIGQGQPADIVKELNIGEVAGHNPLEISKKLAYMINNKHRYILNNNKLNSYRSENISKELAAIFDGMLPVS